MGGVQSVSGGKEYPTLLTFTGVTSLYHKQSRWSVPDVGLLVIMPDNGYLSVEFSYLASL
jgi:hypothetical protein